MVKMDKSDNSNEGVIGENSLISSSMEYPPALELSLEGFENVLLPELTSHLMAVDDQATNPEEGAIVQLMDIQEPLSKLQMLLEDRLGLDLTGYNFILQNKDILESHTNLVDRCVQSEGVVQINVKILASKQMINIEDVLNPTEQYINVEDAKPEVVTGDRKMLAKVKEGKIKHWQVDFNFKKEQERLKIPADPEQWEVVHVKHWLQWAVRQFNLPNLKLSDWEMTGRDLFKLTIKDFQKMVPKDPDDIFWTHIELLRQMRQIATMKHDVNSQAEVKNETKLMRRSKLNKVIPLPSSMHVLDMSNRSGSGGQVQLWQFLIDLLTSPDYRNIIHWLGRDGEFKLSNPDAVAQLWGERKNKPTMNYEKLSRALRYYYEGDMISKVPGKRFVYRFVCDLKQVIGYSAVELANLVNYGNPHYSGYPKQ